MSPNPTTVAPALATSAARLNPPHVFSGKRDGFSALTWIRTIKCYFVLAKIAQPDYTPHAISYLDKEGPARWFDGSGLADDCDFETEFVPAFKSEYVPHNFSSVCRKAITNLQMVSDFPTFLANFKEYLNALLSNTSDASAKSTICDFAQTSFIDNCPKVLRTMIEGQLVKDPDMTLIDIFTFADKMDKIYHIQPDTKPAKSDSFTITTTPAVSSSISPSNPMAMDLDNIKV
ncbi:hypothetical protein FBU30_002719, partial [Linnemannia zychae]